MSTRRRHPALELYQELFTKWATPDNPALPEYIVSRSTFIAHLKARGIEHPANIVRMWEWEEQIGLRRFSRRIVNAYRKKLQDRRSETSRTLLKHDRLK